MKKISEIQMPRVNRTALRANLLINEAIKRVNEAIESVNKAIESVNEAISVSN